MIKFNKKHWNGKRVLITGHTGFKGSWASIMLAELGAELHGLSLPVSDDNPLFKAAGLASLFSGHYEGDIRDEQLVQTVIENVQPDVIFHMAAQPLVRKSYSSPLDTFRTNIQGTANVTYHSRTIPNLETIICVTSDKCYENVEQIWGYREHDKLGGLDPYSASKGAAEIVFKSVWHSYFKGRKCVCFSVRAGNVVGGGDWSADRIMTDIVDAFVKDGDLEIRNPHATRPWQHVIEPLTAYIHLAESSAKFSTNECHSFNVGPRRDNNRTVREVAEKAKNLWASESKIIFGDPSQMHEASLLSLDSTKLETSTDWTPKWGFEETMCRAMNWYKSFAAGKSAYTLCRRDILDYGSVVSDD